MGYATNALAGSMMEQLIEITVEGQLIKAFTPTELERELYERNITYEELCKELIDRYHVEQYENIDFESKMFINKKRMPKPLPFWKESK